MQTQELKEFYVLNYLMTVEGFPHVKYIGTKFFKNQYVNYIFAQVQEFYKKYEKRPIVDELAPLCEKNALEANYPKSEIRKLVGFVENIYSQKESYELAKDEVLTYVKNKKITMLMSELAQAQTQAQGLLDQETLQEYINKINRIKSIGQISDIIDPQSGIVERGHLDEKLGKVPIMREGIKKFCPQGYYFGGAIYMEIGRPKEGKSLDRLDEATRFALAGYNVLYVDLENRARPVQDRVKTNMLKKETHFITHADIEYLNEKRNERIDKLGAGDVYALSFKRNATIENINLEMNRLKDNNGLVPHIIVIDHLLLLEPSKPIFGNISDTVKLGVVIKELKSLLAEWNIPCLTMGHTSTTANDREKDITEEDVAFKRNLRDLDVVTTIQQIITNAELAGTAHREENPEQLVGQYNLYKVNVLASRNGWSRRGNRGYAPAFFHINTELQAVYDVTFNLNVLNLLDAGDVIESIISKEDLDKLYSLNQTGEAEFVTEQALDTYWNELTMKYPHIDFENTIEQVQERVKKRDEFFEDYEGV